MIFIGTMFLVFFLITLGIFIFFRKKLTIFEFIGVTAAYTLIILSGYAMSISSQALDREIYSGKVVSKKRVEVSCRHSYPCHCREECEGSGKNESCSEVCDTCYMHPYDVDWDVNTSIGVFSIDTVDSQGLIEPKRWSEVKNGDPVSKSVSYDNWIKAVPNSLYHTPKNISMPAYPIKIYDYYKVDRLVIDRKVKIPEEDSAAINAKISDSLKYLAAEKQVNIVIVLTDKDESYTEDLKAAWLNGKKNDLVVVIGTTDYPKINWVNVFSWSSEDVVNVATKDEVLDYGTVNTQIVDIITENIKKYWVRKRMHEYEYLKKEIEPGTTATILISLLVIAAIGGLVYYFIVNNNPQNYDRF